MFATNVLGPFLFTQLLMGRLQEAGAVVLHVIAPFYEDIDWDDLESIKHHDTDRAYHRTKTMDRIIAAELARRPGEPIADLMVEYPDRQSINGALFKLGKRVTKLDRP
jgi:hypothetical protein